MGKKNKHTLLKAALLAASSVAAMGYYNVKSAKKAATMNALQRDTSSYYFNWNSGKIFYTVQGCGAPIVLIHDYLSPAGSWEWNALAEELSFTNKVYTLDLPGCGNSDKTYQTFADYLYVQAISSFLKEIVREKAVLVASGTSIQTVLMLQMMDTSMISSIYAINPPVPTARDTNDLAKNLLGQLITNSEVVGSFAYNLLLSEQNLDHYFTEQGYFTDKSLQAAYVKACWQGAHNHYLHNKYILTSYYRGYMNSNLTKAVQELSVPMTILAGSETPEIETAVATYEAWNSEILIYTVDGGKKMMQLERPEEIAGIIAGN